MIKFDSDNIVVGFIKQVLHDFNLPSCPVNPAEEKIVEGLTYIDKNRLCQVVNSEVRELRSYFSGSKLPDNLERHFVIKNNNYDSYTHEYLGNYLRFMRDYNNLDLMPLYNCFSNRIINIEYKNFDSTTQAYKIYAIPVKFFKEYTIAVDCFDTVEMFCGYYNRGFYKITNDDRLYTETYSSVSNTTFNKPFVFSKLVDFIPSDQDILKEDDLKLFLKLPLSNNSSITILEGNYTICAEQITSIKNNIPNSFSPEIIYNYEELEKISKGGTPLSSRLQLLGYNSGVSYPFADKLIGYLLGHFITNLEDIPDNNMRLKKQLCGISEYIRELIQYNVEDGSWSDEFKIIIADYIQKQDRNLYNSISDNQDILGYFDKDAEKYFKDVNIYTDW